MALDQTEDVALHLYADKWIKEQLELKKRVIVGNRHNWILPDDLTQIITDNNDPNIGIIRKLANEESKEFNDNNNKSDPKSNGKTKTKRKRKRHLRLIAGVDISPAKSYTFEDDAAVASLVICEYPSMKVLHNEMQVVKLTQPYIAGFLAFREVEHLVKLINNVKQNLPDLIPDIILVDGNGILHYRGVGLATHLGVLVNIPTIGVAKRLLNVHGINCDSISHKVNYPFNYQNSEPLLSKYMTKKGGFYKIICYNYKNSGKYDVSVIGAALKTCNNSECVYVSIGHRVTLTIALRIVMDCCLMHDGRLPYPIYQADKQSRIKIRNFEKNYQNDYAFNLYKNTKEYNNNNNESNNNHGPSARRQRRKKGKNPNGDITMSNRQSNVNNHGNDTNINASINNNNNNNNKRLAKNGQHKAKEAAQASRASSHQQGNAVDVWNLGTTSTNKQQQRTNQWPTLGS